MTIYTVYFTLSFYILIYEVSVVKPVNKLRYPEIISPGSELFRFVEFSFLSHDAVFY